MFVYHYTTIDEPFEDLEPRVLEALEGMPGFAEVAYRRGQEVRARISTGHRGLAKTVRLHVGEPHRGDEETVIPVLWEAVGAPGLFPRLDADLIVSALGPEVTHLSFRGSYKPPLGPLGRLLDRTVMHRVAEVSIEEFVGRLVEAVTHPTLIAGATPRR